MDALHCGLFCSGSPPRCRAGVLRWDPDSEQALLQLETEELAVGNAERSTAGASQVRGQQRFGSVPGPCASPELPHIMIAGTFKHQ